MNTLDKLKRIFSLKGIHEKKEQGSEISLSLFDEKATAVDIADFFVSILKGDEDGVKIFIKKFPDQINSKPPEPPFGELQNYYYYSSHCLSSAIAHSQINIFNILVDAGVDPNFRIDGTGYTPLMYAADDSDRALNETMFLMADILLKRGADPKIKNAAGLTARDLTSNTKMRELLLRDDIALFSKGLPDAFDLSKVEKIKFIKKPKP